MKLYLLVTRDKYELPLYVADTAEELAQYCGVDRTTVLSMVSRSRRGRNHRSRYICVEIPDPPDRTQKSGPRKEGR